VQLRGHRVGGLSLEVSRARASFAAATLPLSGGAGVQTGFTPPATLSPRTSRRRPMQYALNGYRVLPMSIAAALHAENAACRRPLLDEAEVERRAKSCSRCASRPTGCLTPGSTPRTSVRASVRAWSCLLPTRHASDDGTVRGGTWLETKTGLSEQRPAPDRRTRAPHVPRGSFEHRRWPTSTSSPSLLLPEGC
jgi:hypothetical protein